MASCRNGRVSSADELDDIQDEADYWEEAQ